MQQVTNKRRIVIDDDDDWPQPCPKPVANGKNSPDLFCREQCLTEGAVVPSAAVVDAVPPCISTNSRMPALISDRLSEDGSASEDDEPILKKKLPGGYVYALRTLGLLKEEHADNGPSSRRAFRQIERWAATSAAVAVEVDEPLSER